MQTLETRQLGKIDGFDLVAYKMVDLDSSTEDAECYSEEDIQANREGQWSYVGVIVKAFKEGIELGEDAIWGVEDGYSPGFVDPEHRPTGWADGFDHTLGGDGCYDLPAGAIGHAKEALAQLRREERGQAKRWPRRRRVAHW